tara:strand:+ start:18 stop:167 length:150 start_codon:yes stop_codon:yes gene_type:complete
VQPIKQSTYLGVGLCDLIFHFLAGYVSHEHLSAELQVKYKKANYELECR